MRAHLRHLTKREGRYGKLKLPTNDTKETSKCRLEVTQECVVPLANLTFGGPKKNRLYMASCHSLYALYVEANGAT
jgi:sugar lactone lactonase YvrE